MEGGRRLLGRSSIATAFQRCAVPLGIARRSVLKRQENVSTFFPKEAPPPSGTGRCRPSCPWATFGARGDAHRSWRVDMTAPVARTLSWKRSPSASRDSGPAQRRKKGEREECAGKKRRGVWRSFFGRVPARPTIRPGVPERLCPPACPEPGTDLRRH